MEKVDNHNKVTERKTHVFGPAICHKVSKTYLRN